jgi:small subunit ribosomal protein S8
MSVTDPIADMLTVLRNAVGAKKRWVVFPASRAKKSVLEVLSRERFIRSFEEIDDSPRNLIRVHLKYDRADESVISGLKKVSTPGRRVYVGHAKIPRVLGGLGTALLSTSQGVLTDKEARARGLGGEWICNVW